jgi:hypothetical protein
MRGLILVVSRFGGAAIESIHGTGKYHPRHLRQRGYG